MGNKDNANFSIKWKTDVHWIQGGRQPLCDHWSAECLLCTMKVIWNSRSVMRLMQFQSVQCMHIIAQIPHHYINMWEFTFSDLMCFQWPEDWPFGVCITPSDIMLVMLLIAMLSFQQNQVQCNVWWALQSRRLWAILFEWIGKKLLFIMQICLFDICFFANLHAKRTIWYFFFFCAMPEWHFIETECSSFAHLIEYFNFFSTWFEI